MATAKKAPKKSAKKAPAKPKKPAIKKASAKKRVPKKTAPKKATPKKKVAKAPAPKIIKINHGPIIGRKDDEAIGNTTQNKPARTGKTIDGVIGVSEYRQDIATPRRKLKPHALDVKGPRVVEPQQAPTDHQLEEHYQDAEPELGEPPEADLDKAITIEEALSKNDPFNQLVDDYDVHEQQHVDTGLRPDRVSKPEAKHEVEDMETPRTVDTTHYHVPIRSRALKGSTGYLFEFLIIVLLIIVFVVILIDAEIYNPGFELPFDVI